MAVTLAKYIKATFTDGKRLRAKAPKVQSLSKAGKLAFGAKALWDDTVLRQLAREVQLWRFMVARQIKTQDGKKPPVPKAIGCVGGTKKCPPTRQQLEAEIQKLPPLMISSKQIKAAGGTGGIDLGDGLGFFRSDVYQGQRGPKSTVVPERRWAAAPQWPGQTATDVEVVPGSAFFGLEELYGFQDVRPIGDLGVVPLAVVLPWAVGAIIAITAVIAGAFVAPAVIQAFNGDRARMKCLDKVLELSAAGKKIPPELAQKCQIAGEGGSSFAGSIKTLALVGAGIAGLLLFQKRAQVASAVRSRIA